MTRRPDLPRLGGKGANLVRLREAGLPVPPFVVLETDEYEVFVFEHGLAPTITAALHEPAAVASDAIRAAFAAARPSAEQRARLLRVLAPLLADGDLIAPVAVRSSATAEDLPGHSFAGQQDTFLGVTTLEEALTRVVECWSSLWTERAITYRRRNALDHADVAIAVVVQQMVDADASGVLFTANPSTGRRDESVVEAVAGLGDALASGRVTPVTSTVETATGNLRSQTLAGGAAPLAPTHLQAVVALGRRIVELYGEPMDIEWARSGDSIHVLQARPITSLYPLPAPNPDRHDEPEVWFSLGAFQGMLEPMTPLGQDALRMVLAGAPRLVGRRVDWRTNRFVQPAGERLWVRFDGLMRTRATRKFLLDFLPMVEPGSIAILTDLADEPGLRPTRVTPTPRIAAGLATLVPRVAPRVRAAPTNPAAARRALDRAAEHLVEQVERMMTAAAGRPTPQARLTARVQALEDYANRAFPVLLPAFAPIMLPTMLELRSLRELAARTGLPDADALAMAALRALPGNVTTEMDLTLADVAAEIRRDATSWGWVAETPASDLARQFLTGRLPRVAQASIARFLDAYGMRGVAEIDLGALRWRDDPTPVMHTIKSYLSLPASASPRALHKEGQHEAGRSIRRLMDASPPARALRIKRSAQAIRGLAGGRETPKFTMIRCFGIIRTGLDASAAELVEAGRLGAVADLAFLHVDELNRAFAADWHQLVAQRRAVAATEARRARVPRVLVEDGRAFHEGISAGNSELGGMGVSPGVAEGAVRVVLDPRTTQLHPGEILVCPGTDPAWTPLFLAAAGLITEVGGLMTHGSVVAREYGLPAVVGVHDATTRLADGQRVRIDGTSGAIELL